MPNKYETIPQPVEAIQFTGENLEEVKAFLNATDWDSGRTDGYIGLLVSGWKYLRLRQGDWAVKDGDFPTGILDSKEFTAQIRKVED